MGECEVGDSFYVFVGQLQCALANVPCVSTTIELSYDEICLSASISERADKIRTHHRSGALVALKI